jgi:parallel beta-helix repeat protein
MNKTKILATAMMILFISIITNPTIAITIDEKETIIRLEGNILYVGGLGPNNYTFIQDAIDNSSDGDTVFVFNGIYYENVKINKIINLIGEDKKNTIIKPKESGWEGIITINASEVNITGFTCNISDDYSCNGIIVNSNNNKISDNIIKNFSRDGGIILRSSYNTISNNLITTEYSTCINIEKGHFNQISDNKLIGKNRQSGGIHLRLSEYNSIKNNFIVNHGVGIAFYYNNKENIISNNEISNNYQGLWFYISDNNFILKNNITNNQEYGVYLFISLKFHIPSDGNRFYCNNFINNGINAYDECKNCWCNFSLGRSIGNYWDDYIGLKFPRIFDFNRNRIGFFPKKITGNIRFFYGTDWFPLMQPYEV